MAVLRSRPPRRGQPLALAAALGLVLSACGGGETDTTVDIGADAAAETDAPAEADAEAPADEAGSGGAEEAAVDTGPKLDPAVLSGQATTVTGEVFELGDLAGQDLVVWFWAPW